MNGRRDIDALYHHGIKGQKWGVRRFQNADGSLTPEGAKRYGLALKGAPRMAIDHLSGGKLGDRGKLLKNKKRFYSELKKNPDLFNSKTDLVISKNGKAYRMTPNKDEKDIRDMKNLYVATNDKDASMYGRYLLGSRTRKQYQRTLGLNEDLRAPSVMKMKKYTYEVLNNVDLTDDEFDKLHNGMSSKEKLKLNRQTFDLNAIIPDKAIDEKSKEKLDKWIEKAKKDNYNSIKDIHDEWYGKTPLIVMDADKSISEINTKQTKAIEKAIMYTYGHYKYDELVDDVKHNDEEDFLMHYGVKGMKWGVRNEEQPVNKPRRYNRNAYVNQAKTVEDQVKTNLKKKFSRSAYVGYATQNGLSKTYKQGAKRSKKLIKAKWNEYHELLAAQYGTRRNYAKAHQDKLAAEQMGISEGEYKLGKNVNKLKQGQKELKKAGKSAIIYAGKIGVNALLKEAGIKDDNGMSALQAGLAAYRGLNIIKNTVSGSAKIISAEHEMKKLDLDQLEEERKKRLAGGQNGGISS